jgi:nucleotide-binding universal stress UspA family protein
MTAPIVIGLALREDDAAPLALGKRLAQLTGAPLALVSAYMHEVGLPQPVPELDAVLFGETQAALEEHANPLGDRYAATTHAHHGSPGHVLHQVSEDLHAGVVVVGSSHRGRLGRVLPGNVTAAVLHGSGCAVAVAPRGYSGDAALERIAVAFDGSDESRDALAVAAAIAQVAEASLHSYTVMQRVESAPALTMPGWSVPASHAETFRIHAERVVGEARAALPEGMLEQAELLEGRPGNALVGVSLDADLLVCGSRGYGALRAVALGSASRALVTGAACPVLVMPRTPERHRLDALLGGRPAATPR